MGSLHAAEFASLVREGTTALETALAWHLQSNHYPPLPTSLIPACTAAIDAANDGDWDRKIELPEGVTWRDQSAAPAHAIIEGHHLEGFLDAGEECEDDWEDGE